LLSAVNGGGWGPKKKKVGDLQGKIGITVNKGLGKKKVTKEIAWNLGFHLISTKRKRLAN